MVKVRKHNKIDIEKENRNKTETDTDTETGTDSGFYIKNNKQNYSKFIKKNQDPDKLSLGHILNLFDGIKETPGRIIIITTNHADKIDPALKRPGRIDLHIKMNCIDFNILNQMYYYYFNSNINKDKINNKIKNINNNNINPRYY